GASEMAIREEAVHRMAKMACPQEMPCVPCVEDAESYLDALLDYLEAADFDRVLWEAYEEYEYARQCFDEAVSAEADLHRVAPDEPWADLEKHRPWFSSFVLAVLRKEAD